MKSTLAPKPTKANVSLKKVARLFKLGTQMADLAEEILEERGAYSPSFLSALAEAQRDVKAGRVYTIESLDELVPKR